MLRLFFLTLLISLSLETNAQSKIRLIGFDFGGEYSLPNKNKEFGKENIKGIVPEGYEFCSDKASPSALVFGQLAAATRAWRYQSYKKYYRQVNINALFQIKTKDGNYNPNHFLNIGIGQQFRQFLSGSFVNRVGNTTVDTSGSAVYFGDTLDVINYTDNYQSSTAFINARVLTINLGYQHRFYPFDKISLSIGGGLDLGVIYKGFFLGRNNTYTQTESYASGISAGTFFNAYDSKRFSSKINGILVRPYADLTANWQVNKKVKKGRGINFFVSARVGYDGAKLRKSTFYGDTFTSIRFGISYIFDKYYNA
jgi:hypothetical protein